MDLEFINEDGFSININGEIEYNGEVICIKNEFRYCSNEQKINQINVVKYPNENLSR